MPDIQKTPLVSVVMIFLNAEKFIQEAIQSVTEQTYSNWELIFVDDGSSDASTEIALRYAQKYPDKMRYFEHEGHQNRGMSASRNRGIEQSQGEYIALLDADDVYLPQKLEKEVALLNAQPTASMVYGTTQYWYSWTGEPDDLQRDQLRTLGVQTDRLYDPPELFRRFLDNTARTPATCSALIRQKSIKKVGGFEDHFSGMFEDQVFFYKLCLHEPVYVESGCWSRYRQHPDSYIQISRQNGTWDPARRHPRTRVTFMNWLENYLVEQKVTDPFTWKTLRRELWAHRHPRLDYLRSIAYRVKKALRERIRKLLQGKSLVKE